MIISTVFMALYGLVVGYMILCSMSIWIRWFPTRNASKLAAFTGRVCDPWLNLFRSPRFSKGTIDFSPVLALGVLWILSNVLYTLGIGGRFSFGQLFALLVDVVWQFLAFLLTMHIVLGAVRAVAYFARWNTFGPAWQIVEGILNPALYRLNRIVHGKRVVNYLASLFTMLAVFVALRVSGEFLFLWVERMLRTLPF